MMGNVLEYLTDVGDPRVKDWFMMSTAIPGLMLTIAYILFVTKIGPKWMEDKKAYELKNTILLYNIFQILINAYIFYEAGIVAWFRNYRWFCEPVDVSTSPAALRMASVSWVYLIMKYVDFLDTVFYILRKKNNQVTALHVFHHSYMAIATWIGVKFKPGGRYSFFGFLNSLVHVLMYTYYLLAAMGPQMRKYLWWKKYLTILQMTQFVVILLHVVVQVFMKDCSIDLFFLLIVFGSVPLLILFANYYGAQYTTKNVHDRQKCK